MNNSNNTTPPFEQWMERLSYTPPEDHIDFGRYFYEGREVMTEYSYLGFDMKPVANFYLITYFQEDGRLVIPAESKAKDVDYPEDIVFGNVPESDIPEHCDLFDFGYGGPWEIRVWNGMKDPLERTAKYEQRLERNKKIAFETAYKMWLRAKDFAEPDF